MARIPIRILLVEDNPDDSDLIQIHLDDIDAFDVTVECFPRLAIALQRLDEVAFDIAMLDLSLPDSHGIETVERVRKHSPYLPIIILTGLNDQHVAYEAARTGAQDYLVKGRVDPDALGRCLRYALERARVEAELRQHRDHLEELVEARSSELREKSDRLQLLATAIEYAAEAMFITDANMEIRYANPAFEALTGYSTAEIEGKTPRILRSDEHDEKFFADIYSAIAPGKPWRGNIVNRKKNGADYLSYVVISCVCNDDGSVRNYIYMGRDVTEENSLRERLNRAQRLDSIGQLAGGIAHDFNNILQAIIGYTRLSLDELDEGSTLYENTNETNKAAYRAAELTKQLLAFSRRQLLRRSPADLNQIIYNLMSLLRRLLREDIDLDFVPGRQLDIIDADTGQIEQVLVNLCVNACDALPHGGRITIETENVALNGAYTAAHPWARAGRFVLLNITDNGVGMPPGVVDRIFEPFYTTKEDRGGTGLGLATCYGIVKQHDGFIHCYSEIDKGTTFKIYLPITTRQTESVGTKVEAAPRNVGTEHILVVEDDLAIRTLSARILRKAGYSVLTANDGAEALDQITRGEKIDLVISDVVMPRMGGLELHTRLREQGMNLPILLASGYSSRVILPENFSHAQTALIQKPFNPDDLLAKIRTLLDGR